jgi:hypothetical protein
MKHFLTMFFFGTESRDPGFDSARFPDPDPEPLPAGRVLVQDFHVRIQHDEAEGEVVEDGSPLEVLRVASRGRGGRSKWIAGDRRRCRLVVRFLGLRLRRKRSGRAERIRSGIHGISILRTLIVSDWRVFGQWNGGAGAVGSLFKKT